MATALFGRDDEHARLRAAWARARAGNGGIVVLSGEPGIGKSALAHAIADEAAGEASVARGRAWEAGDAPAYFPVWPCLRALGLAPPDGRGGDDHAARDFQRWEEVLAALAAASGSRPVLWVVEDLHAADGQTLDLIAFLAGPLRSIAVLVLATMRSADPRLDEATLRRIARITRDADQLVLAPLSRADVAALVRSRVRDVDDPVIDELVARTGGNPLFVVECARGLATSAPRDRSPLSLPPTISASVRERVELLPTATRRILDDAAVLGDEAFSGILARMGATQPATVIDLLGPAVRAGILLESGPGRFRFVHAVVRDVIVDALSAAARADAHGRAAAALATVGSPEAVVDRAHHALGASGRAADVRAAVDAAVALLVQQGTHDRAQRLFERLLDACARGELPGPSVDDRLVAARLAHDAGSYAHARAHCLDALVLARRAGDARGLAEATLALGADLRPGEIDEVLVRALDEAIAAIPADAAALRCRLQARRAAALQPAADPQVPVELARAAIADARALGDDGLRAQVLLVAASAMSDMAPLEETRALAAELLELCRAAGDVSGTLRAYARLVVDTGRLGDLFGFDAQLDAMLQLARTVGHPRLTWRALLLDSMRAHMCGRFDEAERLVTQVEQLARLTDDPALSLSLMAHRMMRRFALYLEGDAAAAIEAIPPQRAIPNIGAVVLNLRIQHAVLFRDAGAAARILASDFPGRLLAVTPSAALFGGVVALAGTAAQCRAHADAMADCVGHHVIEGHIPMAYGGPLRWIVAQLEARAGEPARAEAHYREAISVAQAHAMLPWVARLQLELGELLHAQGRAEGGELLAAAERQADALGLAWLVRAARRSAGGPSAASAGAPPPSVPPRPLSMTRDGALWRVTLGDRHVQLPDARGLELLARLIDHPAQEIHVLVLGSDGAEVAPDSDAGEVLDARAIESYRARIGALDRRLDDARARSDLRNVERFERERELLRAEVARAIGLGGRRRQAGSTSERARVNVQRRLKDGIARIEKLDAEIGRYLRAAVRTGTYCTFRP